MSKEETNLNKENFVKELLTKYSKNQIDINNLSYESNIFEFDELDKNLIPREHRDKFKHESVQVDVYLYNSKFVYFIKILNSIENNYLIGVAESQKLIEYQYIKEGEKNA